MNAKVNAQKELSPADKNDKYAVVGYDDLV